MTADLAKAAAAFALPASLDTAVGHDPADHRLKFAAQLDRLIGGHEGRADNQIVEIARPVKTPPRADVTAQLGDVVAELAHARS